MDTIQQYRQKNPQFNGVPDEALGSAVYEQHYADKMPRSDFDSQFGLSQRIGVLEDVGRSIATGAGEAVHAIPGMLGGLVGAGMQLGRGIDKYIFGNEVKDPAEVAAGNPLQAITPEAFEHYSGFEDIKHQPQTTAGEFARVGANFITPVAPLGAAKIVQLGFRQGIRPAVTEVAKYGVAPAVASETAKRTVKELAPGWEDAAAVLGGLIGGGVMAAISRPSNAALVIKNAMPKGVTNADIMRADAIVREARGRGGTVTWPEALYQATNGRVDVTPLQAIVEQSSGGGPRMAEVMSQRPAQNEAMMTGAMDDLTAGRQMTAPEIAGQTIKKSAADTIDDINKWITQQSSPYYQKSANKVVPLPHSIQNNPYFQEALAGVRADKYRPEIVGLPDHSVGVLNEVKKYLSQQAEDLATKPEKRHATALLGATERDVRGAAVANKDYERALGIETDLRRRFLDPAKSGPLGALSRTDDILSQAGQVINRTAEGSEQAIAQTIRLLSRRSPDAAFQLVRTHLRGAFDAAASGTLDQRQGGNFSKAVLGNKQEAANLEAAIRALPDGDIRWQGFRSFLEVMEAQSRRRGEGSPTAGRLERQAEMKKGGPFVEGIRVARTGGIGKRVDDLYDQWKYGQVSEKMAQIFTAPGSAAMFKKLASMRTPAGKKMVMGYLLAFYGGQQSGTAQPLNMDVTGELTNPGLKPNRDVSGRVTGFTPGK